MVESFTPRVDVATQDFKIEKSSEGQGRPAIVWGQGIQIRPSKKLPQPSDSSSRPSATLPISPASVSDAISRLLQEKARIQKDLDQRKAEHEALKHHMVLLRNEKDYLAADNEKKQQLIKSFHQELGEVDAELDDDEDDYPLIRRIRRECERRVKDCEERLKQYQAEGHMQAMILDKVGKDLKDARGEADDAQRGAITMFNEQKRYELNIQRLQSDVHRANSAMEKMRTEAVGLKMKILELWDERNDRQRLFDGAESENQAALEERDSTIADLRSLLDRRRRKLDGLEKSTATIQDEQTRLQLHSNEISMSLVALRQELDEARAVATAARVSEEAGRQQLARVMEEQLAQTQTIEALRRQVETSNNAARDAQALLRATQDQQQQYLRMPPPSNLPATTRGNIGNTPFVAPLSTPSTGPRILSCGVTSGLWVC